MPDRDVQSLIVQAGEIRTESRDLRKAILDFQDALRRGLIRASIQGVVMVFIGIVMAISFLGILSKPYTCDGGNLSHQIDSWHYKVCNVVFPQTGTQAKTLKATRDATKAADDQRQQVLDERKKTNDFLEKFPRQVGCILKIHPEDRTDANVNACLGVSP